MITISSKLSGHFRILTVEERFDKNKSKYLIDENGFYYVPVDITVEIPVAVMPVAEVFKQR